eukprot:TRINITY_DN1126_c0_g1_i1.p1 TRINITY_DN1126_c0_g1~~TRINITY_DN1126_c0_g1_i1.p1  ORF type:complete len:488 (-),score=78.76 TRINITY_DN1126_c0_g1_i1:70-1533(-)
MKSRGRLIVGSSLFAFLLLFISSLAQESLHWERVPYDVNATSLPHPRWLPASAVRAGSNKWTIISGEVHATEDEEAYMLRDYWELDFFTNKFKSNPQIASPTFVSKGWRKAFFNKDTDLILWAGKGNADTNTLHIYSNANHAWTDQPAEFPHRVWRGYAGILVQTNPETLFIFGGVDERVQAFGAAGFYSFEFKRSADGNVLPVWVTRDINVLLGSPLPGARYFHSGVYRSEDNSWYIFGGTKNLNLGNHYNDLWKYSFSQDLWELVQIQGSCAPQARCLHTAVATPDGMGMYVYGGVNYGMVSQSDLWMFHFNTRTWHQIRTTGWDGEDAARDGHAMAIWKDPTRSDFLWIYIYGGDTTSGHTHTWGDVWRANIHNSGCTVDSPDKCRWISQDTCYVKGGIISDRKPALIMFLIVLAAVIGAVAIIGGRYIYKNYRIVEGTIKYQPSTSVLPTPNRTPDDSPRHSDSSFDKKRTVTAPWHKNDIKL